MSKIIVTVAGNDPTSQQSVLDVLLAASGNTLNVAYRTVHVVPMEGKELEVAQRHIAYTNENNPRFGTAKEFKDDAHRTTDAILEDIRDRRGIGNELESFMYDDDVIDNLVDNISALIRVGMKVV